MKVDPKDNHQIFPNPEWASNPENGIGIANAIGIQETEDNKLYVLDWGNENNQLDRIYYIPEFAQNKNSFLQDFTIDQKRKMIYIADMGRADFLGEQAPAILVLNLESGQTKRVLENDASFLPDDKGILINGTPLTVSTAKGKKSLNLGLNPIAIDPDNEWVYYGTVNAEHIIELNRKL